MKGRLVFFSIFDLRNKQKCVILTIPNGNEHASETAFWEDTMLLLWTLFYAIAIAFLAGSFVLFYPHWPLIALSVLVFLFFNLIAGFVVTRRERVRLRFLFHGSVLLIAFMVSLLCSVLLHTLLFTGVIPADTRVIVYSVIYTVILHVILFWNGMLSIYCTSVQLGIRDRVIALVCGFILPVNLIVLGYMIHKTYAEFLFESEKDRKNAARAAERLCATRYPILLVHGVFFRDSRFFNYWGRVPKELERNGAKIFYGKHPSAASVEESGIFLAARIREIVEKTGAEKVNIIAHSKGGLDCRYALEHCNVAELVASLTTVNTPHRGCLFAEWLLEKAPTSLKDKVALSYNTVAHLAGDKEPSFLSAVRDLRADVCVPFDKATPPPENVFCQSIGSVMARARSGKFPLNLSHHFVKHFDGRNDGLVGVDSFAFGSEFTLLDLPVRRGISHADMIDLNRENIKGFDVREFYVELVADLKERGL